MTAALAVLLVALLVFALMVAYAIGSCVGYGAGWDDALEVCERTHQPGSDYLGDPIRSVPGPHSPGTAIKL